MKQYGGEGKEKYKGHKNDANLPQHGGEGGGKEGKVPGGSGSTGLTPGTHPGTDYTGPGRNL